MNKVTDMNTKRTNVNMILNLVKSQRAIAVLDQQHLEVASVSLENKHPLIFIQEPSQSHPIRDLAQPFGTLQRVEIKRFGKLDHHVMWHNNQQHKEA